MLTGSLAAAHYAIPRATQDVDLVVEVSPEQLPYLTDLISSAGFYVSLAAAKEASAQEGQFNGSAGPEFDWDYVGRWVSELGLDEQWEPLRLSLMDRREASDED